MTEDQVIWLCEAIDRLAAAVDANTAAIAAQGKPAPADSGKSPAAKPKAKPKAKAAAVDFTESPTTLAALRRYWHALLSDKHYQNQLVPPDITAVLLPWVRQDERFTEDGFVAFKVTTHEAYQDGYGLLACYNDNSVLPLAAKHCKLTTEQAAANRIANGGKA